MKDTIAKGNALWNIQGSCVGFALLGVNPQQCCDALAKEAAT